MEEIWADVLANKEKQATLTRDSLPMLKAQVVAAENIAADFFTTLEDPATAAFAQVDQWFGGTTIPALEQQFGNYQIPGLDLDCAQLLALPDLQLGWLLDKLGGTPDSGWSFAPLDALTQGIEAFFTDIVGPSDALAAFGQLLGPLWVAMQKAVTTPDQLAEITVALLLTWAKNAVLGTLHTADALVQGALALMGSLIDALDAYLSTDLDLPLISWLYTSIMGGGTLTPRDILCLIVAIPMTIIQDVAEGAARPAAGQVISAANGLPDHAAAGALELWRVCASFGAEIAYTAFDIGLDWLAYTAWMQAGVVPATSNTTNNTSPAWQRYGLGLVRFLGWGLPAFNQLVLWPAQEAPLTRRLLWGMRWSSITTNALCFGLSRMQTTARVPSIAPLPQYGGIGPLTVCGVACLATGIVCATQEDPQNHRIDGLRAADILPSLPILFKPLLPIAGLIKDPEVTEPILAALLIIDAGCDGASAMLVLSNNL